MSMMAPQGAPQGPPPELLAALQAHGIGGPPQPQQDSPGGEDEREPISILKQMIGLANQYIKVEPDAADQATMAKLLATLHQYLMKEQQDAEQALGGGSATRVLRRLG